MKKWIWITVSLLIVVAASYYYYQFSILKPRFVKIDHLKVLESDMDHAMVQADVFIFNPGNINATLLNTELKVSSENLDVAVISQTSSVDIPSNSEFVLPVKCKIDFVKLGLSQGLSSWLEKALNENRTILLKFEGYCNVRYNGSNFRIPVTHEENVRF